MEYRIQHDWNKPNGKMMNVVDTVAVKHGVNLKFEALP